MIARFETFKQYQDFALGRGFATKEKEFAYPKERLEKLGGYLVAPIFRPLDKTLQNVRNPLVILVLTVSAIAALTIAFYPAQFFSTLGKALPILLKITPAHVKFGLYAIFQATILGLGIRTFGRLNNEELVAAWNRGELRPIPLGAVLAKC